MKLRKTVIGDLYLSASLIFIFLAVVYLGFNKEYWWAFLLIGLGIAIIGANAKKVLRSVRPAKKRKTRKKKKK